MEKLQRKLKNAKLHSNFRAIMRYTEDIRVLEMKRPIYLAQEQRFENLGRVLESMKVHSRIKPVEETL
jgi:hypothetical protein